MHLIDFEVLFREGGAYEVTEAYEQQVPKDVVQLHPGNKVAVLAR